METSRNIRDPIELVVDEFLERQRRGEQPSVQEYIDRHPELASEIREVLPALAVIEQVAPASDDLRPDTSNAGFGKGLGVEQIADYRILREIGRGGMGVVYEAEQLSLGRRVALKVLPRQLAGNARSLERFKREARAAAKMHHTNIVPVFEVGTDEEHVFYAMQLIAGQGLDQVIDELRGLRDANSQDRKAVANPATIRPEQRPKSIAESLVSGQFAASELSDRDATETIVLKSDSTSSASLPGKRDISTVESNRSEFYQSVAQVGLQTASALAYAHARGIIHRDIKPSNLLLDAAGTVWIVDFGLAKTADAAMTHTGDLLGTIRYMSPERFQGRCDVRADVYSLGVTLYELLVLTPAYSSADQLRLIDQINKTDARPPRSIDARIPADLETILLKAIDKDPKRRYQSADEMADDLEHFIHDEPIKARRVTAGERLARWSRRNPGMAAALSSIAALVLCFAVGSTSAAVYYQRQEQKQSRLAQENLILAQEKTELAERTERERQNVALAEQRALREADRFRRLSYISDVQLAGSMLDGPDGTGQQVHDLLMDQPNAVQQRQFVWHYWWNRLHPIGRVFQGPQNDTQVIVAVGPESSYYTLNSNGRFDEWTTSSVKPVRSTELSGGNQLEAMAFSADGVSVAISSADNRVGIFDTRTCQRRLTLEMGHHPIGLQFFDDGNQLAVSVTGTIQISTEADDFCAGDFRMEAWDLRSGKMVRLLVDRIRNGASGQATWLCQEDLARAWSANNVVDRSFRNGSRISNDGKLIAIPSYPSYLNASVFHDGVRKQFGMFSPKICVAFSPDGSLVVEGSSNGSFKLYQTPGVVAASTHVRAHTGIITALKFSPDGHLLATGSNEGDIAVWDISTPTYPRELHRFKGHHKTISSFAFSPDRTALISSCGSESRVWNLGLPSKSQAFGSIDRDVKGMSVSPDGERLAVCYGQQLAIWHLEGEHLLRSVSGPAISCAFSPDGRMVAVVGNDHRITLRDATNAIVLRHWDCALTNPSGPDSNHPGSLEFSPDGRYLAVAFGRLTLRPEPTKGNYALKVFHVDSGELVLDRYSESRWISLDFSSDSRLLAASAEIDGVSIMNTQDWSGVTRLKGSGPYYAARFSPDGQWLVVGKSAREKLLLGSELIFTNTSNWTTARRISGLRHLPTDIEFSGDLLLCSSMDHRIRIWDFGSCREMAVLRDAGKETRSIAMTPDDRTLIAAGHGIRLWRSSPRIWSDGERAVEFVNERLNTTQNPEARRSLLSAALCHPRVMRRLAALRPRDWELQLAFAELLDYLGQHDEANLVNRRVRDQALDSGEFQHSESLIHALADRYLSTATNRMDWQVLDLEFPGTDCTTAYSRYQVIDSSMLHAGWDDDWHIVEADCALPEVKSIRLEVLPEIYGGTECESFALRFFQCFSNAGQQGAFSQVMMQAAAANFSGGWSQPGNILDVRSDDGWRCGVAVDGTRWAIFSTSLSSAGQPHRLRFRLRTDGFHAMRRIRISVCDQPCPTNLMRLPKDVVDRQADLPAGSRLTLAAWLARDFDVAQAALDFGTERSKPWLQDVVACIVRHQNGEDVADSLRKLLRPIPRENLSPAHTTLLRFALEFIEGRGAGEINKIVQQYEAGCRLADIRQRTGGDEPSREELLERARLYQTLEMWDRSYQQLATALGMESDVALDDALVADIWLTISPKLILEELLDEYHSGCRTVLDALGPNVTPMIAERLCKTACLLPDVVDAGRLPIAQVKAFVEAGQESSDLKPWACATIALVAYRQGDIDTMLEYANRSLASQPLLLCEALAQTLLALAEHRQGNSDTAAREMAVARERVGEASASKPNHRDTAMAKILLQEAEQLLQE